MKPRPRAEEKRRAFVRVRSSELITDLRCYRRNEPREAVYQAAHEMVDRHWRQHDWEKVSLGVAALLVSWNARVYVGKDVSFAEMTGFLETHAEELTRLRGTDLHGTASEVTCRHLFNGLTPMLMARSRRGPRAWGTPVGVAKALHIIAPRYFPLWDRTIATAAGHSIPQERSRWAGQYESFALTARRLVGNIVKAAQRMSGAGSTNDALEWLRLRTNNRGLYKTWLKFADEYNYARHVLKKVNQG